MTWTEREMRYIPLADQDEWRAKGWTVDPLKGSHGAYSALAWREVSG